MPHKHKADAERDRALEQTFPASDPATPDAITGTEKPGSDIKRKAPRISRAEVEAATQKTVECPMCHGIGRVAAPIE